MTDITDIAEIADIGMPRRAVPVLGWFLLAISIVASGLSMAFMPAILSQLPLPEGMAGLVLFYVAFYGPLALVAIVFALTCRMNPFAPGDRSALWLAAGLLMGAGGVALGLGYAMLAGSAVPGATISGAVASSLLIGALVVLFQSASEELFFRGWVQPFIAGQWGAWPAIALSALLFMAFHLLGGVRAPLSLVNLFLGGIWFALLAVRSQGVVAPIAAHFGWNASEELLFGLIPNPGASDFGVLFDWDLAGHALWGGTEEGLNASIAMTAILLALILPLIRREMAAPDVRPAPQNGGVAVQKA